MKITVHKRESLSPKEDAQITILGIFTALFAGGLIMALAGLPPVDAYWAIFKAGFFGGAYSISDTLVKAIPLILCGIGCAVAFRAGLWNVGAEGQLFIGAWAATGVASFWTAPELSAWIKIPLMMITAMTAGAFWGAVPGILKVRYRVSEILSSLMLVYVAIYWNTYWIYSPWSDKGFQLTPQFPESATLPQLSDLAGRFPALAGLTIHAGLFIAIGAVVLLGLIQSKSRWGFVWRAMGDNPNAAKASGMNVSAHTVLVMAICGAAAGLAGAVEVSGVVHRLQERFSPGFGFTAITIAWLARLNPWTTALVAFIFGGVLVGSKQIGSQGISYMLQGTLLLVLILFEWFRRYRIEILFSSEDVKETA